jgi:hypothetical protein
LDEATEIIILTSLVQTVVITLTLLVFIFQFRSQEKAIKESSYQNLMGRYNDFMMMQAEKPELNKLLRDQLHGHGTKSKITPEDTSLIVNLLIAYGIIEEAFLLYTKRWIDEETWRQWAVWLKDLAKHPRFVHIHRRMQGQFDKRFEDYVSKVLEEK